MLEPIPILNRTFFAIQIVGLICIAFGFPGPNVIWFYFVFLNATYVGTISSTLIIACINGWRLQKIELESGAATV